MTNAVVEALGNRPIHGEIPTGYSYRRTEQWDNERFLPLLDAVLNIEGVDSVRWHQYTPGFNDGDACTFTLGEPEVKLIDGDEEAGDREDGYVNGYDFYDYVGSYPNSKKVAKPGFEELHATFEELSGAFDHFEIFLEDTFGNGSEITAKRDGFHVDYYDCGY